MNAMAVGSGSLKKQDAQRIIREWNRQVNVGQRRARKGPGLRAVAAMHGIPVYDDPAITAAEEAAKRREQEAAQQESPQGEE